MKKKVCLVFAVVALLMASAFPAVAWWRGDIYVGPGWGYGPYPYPYPYYGQPPVVIQQQPPVYVQPAPQYAPQASQQDEEDYWYYCHAPKGYYPYVKRCPGGWLKVVPSTTPPDQRMKTAAPVPSPNQGASSVQPPVTSIPPDMR